MVPTMYGEVGEERREEKRREESKIKGTFKVLKIIVVLSVAVPNADAQDVLQFACATKTTILHITEIFSPSIPGRSRPSLCSLGPIFHVIGRD